MEQMIAFTVLAGLTPLVFIMTEIKKGGAAAALCKTLASLTFFLLGLIALSQNPTPAGFAALGALVLGMVGDILLGVCQHKTREDNLYLIGGIIAFGCEHVAMILAVIRQTGFSLSRIGLSLAMGAIFGCATVLFEKRRLGFRFGNLVLPAAVYASLLAGGFCFYLLTSLTAQGGLLLPIGMGLFLFSDLVLSGMYFGGKKGGIYSVLNLTTYYAGQILFAWAIFLF